MSCPKKCRNSPPNSIIDINTCKIRKQIIPYSHMLGIKLLPYIPDKRTLNSVLTHVTKTKCEEWNHQTPEEAQKSILEFIRQYNIDWKQASKCRYSKTPEACAKKYKSKNEFFARKLWKKFSIAGGRSPKQFVSPSDSSMVVFDNVSKAKEVWIKGETFTVAKLLQNKSNYYKEATICVFRLAPDDYHRFHFPVNCKVKKIVRIAGNYMSVQSNVINSNIDVLGENRRVVCYLSTKHFGTIALVIVGATCVGSIKLRNDIEKKKSFYKGQEMGEFAFGGSTIVAVIPKNHIKICKTLLKNSLNRTESYVRVGNLIGSV